MIDPGLAGKVVLITGANHGIGAATARALASARRTRRHHLLSRAAALFGG